MDDRRPGQPGVDEIEFDPPLGSVPDFTFSHPVLRGMNERWRRGGGSTRLMAILKDGGNVQAFRMLVRTTLAMVGVPALVMLTMQHLVLDRLFTFASAGDKMVWAGVAGLCSVQLVVIAFLVAAFRDDGDEQAEAKKSK